MNFRPFRERRVDIPNGATLGLVEWPGRKGPLVCLHGLTSSSRGFVGLAEEMPDYRLLSIDLRGRGSSSKSAPFGLVQHADDLAALLDDAGIKRASFVGHSMGAYILGAFASRYPSQVDKLVFVDGGFWGDDPAGRGPDAVFDQEFSMFVAKLSRIWTSKDEYVDSLSGTPLYPDGIDIYGRVHLEYDLAGTAPLLQAKINRDCIRADWMSLNENEEVVTRLRAVHQPVLILRAPGGLTGHGDEVINAKRLAVLQEAMPQAEVVEVPGTNHHTILLSIDGAKAVAGAVDGFLARSHAPVSLLGEPSARS